MKKRFAFACALPFLASPIGCGSTDDSQDNVMASAEITACTEAAMDFAALCTNDSDRSGQVAVYQRYCVRASEPAAAAAALDCLLRASSSVDCRIFSDPQDDSSCVETALTPVFRPEWMQIVTILQTQCGIDGPASWTQIEPPFVLMSDRQIGELSSCLSTATDCTSADACIPAGPDRGA